MQLWILCIFQYPPWFGMVCLDADIWFPSGNYWHGFEGELVVSAGLPRVMV